MHEELNGRMRVLHMPYNIGGGTWRLVEAERRLGLDSNMLTFYGSKPGMDSGGIDLGFSRNGRAGKSAKRLAAFLKYAGRFDVFHFYFGESFLFSEDLRVNHWDLPVLKHLGKKIFMTFQGCDLRRKEIFLKEYEYSVCSFCDKERCDKKKDKARARSTIAIQQHANQIYVSTPDLLFLVPGAEVMPQTAPWAPRVPEKYRAPSMGEVLKVFHGPSNRSLKGTKYLAAACEKLKSEGYPVELVLSENMDWRENMELMKSSHLVVDQLCGMWYGNVSVEAMTWGLPVICDINEKLKTKAGYGNDFPIINANFKSIYFELRKCLENPIMLNASAKKGPAFSSKYHSPESLAEKTARSYGLVIN